MPRTATDRAGARAGLTLLELLLVMALLGLLLGFGMGVLANLEIGSQQAAGVAREALRSAHATALLERAPAQLEVAEDGRTLAVRGMRTLATWNFEREDLEGAHGIRGTFEGGLGTSAIVDDGYIGKGLSLAGAGRDGAARFALETLPAFDFREGFRVDVSARRDRTGAGLLWSLADLAQLYVTEDGALEGSIVLGVPGDASREKRGARVDVASPPGALQPGRFARVSLAYDRTLLTLEVDGARVAVAPATDALPLLEGSFVLGGRPRPFPGPLDAVVLRAGAQSDPVELAEGVTWAPDSPRVVRFGPDGALDPTLHQGAVVVAVLLPDGTRDHVSVGVYGTVETRRDLD